MPRPKGKRTSKIVNDDIGSVVRKKDKAAGEFRSQLVELANEYDTAVGKEAAQKKYDSMGKAERIEFARLIEENK